LPGAYISPLVFDGALFCAWICSDLLICAMVRLCFGGAMHNYIHKI